MAELKMAAIIKLIRLNKFESESEWSESVFEWIWEKITRYLNPKRVLSEFNMVEFKMAAIIN